MEIGPEWKQTSRSVWLIDAILSAVTLQRGECENSWIRRPSFRLTFPPSVLGSPFLCSLAVLFLSSHSYLTFYIFFISSYANRIKLKKKIIILFLILFICYLNWEWIQLIFIDFIKKIKKINFQTRTRLWNINLKNYS